MKICYTPRRFGPERLALYEKINAVLADLVSQGYTPTLRQLFYQLVSRGLADNNKDRWGRLSKEVSQGRMGGMIDWDWIEDRLRTLAVPTAWENPGELIAAAVKQYRLDRQKGQKNRIEIWAEKDAVSEIVGPLARKLGIPFLIGRGQFSISCMKEAVDRWDDSEDRRRIVILYFGDFDPSGVFSIEQSIRERTQKMSSRSDIEFIRVAIPESDLIRSKLPPSFTPIKAKDPCRAEYIARYGTDTWELEAMKPSAIQKLLEKALEEWMDFDVYSKVLKREERDRQRLARMIA